MSALHKVFLLIMILTSLVVFGQHGVGTNDPNIHAVLDVAAADKGIILPRISLSAANALTPITGPASDAHNGMIVYNTNPAVSAGLSGTGYYSWSGGGAGSWKKTLAVNAPDTSGVLSWNGTDWEVATSNTHYSIFPIWAEEGGGLNNNALEWAYGNGEETIASQGIPVPVDAELFAIGVALGSASNSTISVLVNGSVAATSDPFSGAGSAITTLANPIGVEAGDLINFRTLAAGTATNMAQVVAWFRSVSLAVHIGDFMDVDTMTTTPTTNDYLSWNGYQWETKTPPAIPNFINDLSDVNTLGTPPNTGDILQWNGNHWTPVAASAIDDIGASAGISNSVIIDFNDNTSFVDRALATNDFNEFTTDVSLDGTGFAINTDGTYYISYSGQFTGLGVRNTILLRIDAGGTIGGQEFIYLRNSESTDQGAASGSFVTRLNAGDLVRLQSRREGDETASLSTDSTGSVSMHITRLN